MAINLKIISSEVLRIVIPAFHTQKLFDAALQLHNFILKNNKYQNKEADLLLQDLIRKKSIIEIELRNRCVTKKIYNKRLKGHKIDNYEKIRQHSEFTKFFRDYLEKNSKRFF